jgi:alpha-mannosidase
MEVKEIIIAFKTHFDIGYTDYAEAILQKYGSSMITGAMDVLENTRSLPPDRRFVWTVPGWPMSQILKRCDPALKPGVVKAIAEGWFAVHALPFTFETEASDLENLARCFSFSSTIARQQGLPLPRDAKLTDVPSHSWIISTLLTQAGVNILHIGCNAASRSPEVPLLFWWEGPDGSRLLTMYWGEYYGTSLTPPEGWPFSTWLAIIHTNDNVGAPSPADVEKVLSEARTLAPNARLKIGRISDFYDALMKENPQLPVVRGDMPDTWIHGYMSMPKEVKASRSVRKEIFTLEALNTLCGIWSGERMNVVPVVSEALESALLFDEHTFGMAMSHGHSGHWCYGEEFKTERAKGMFKPIEDSWKEKSDRVYQAERIIAPTLSQQLRDLARAIDCAGPRVVVYNPLPWARTGVVSIQAHSRVHPFTALKDVESGTVLNLVNEGNLLQFVAKDVPSMGYRTYVPAEEIVRDGGNSLMLDEEAGVFENEFLRCAIDTKKGTILSLRSKQTGKEMVNAQSEFGFGQYVYERFSKANTEAYTNAYVKGGWDWSLDELGRPNLTDEPYCMVKGTGGKTTFTKNSVCVSAVVQIAPHQGMPHDMTLIITLYRNLPYAEFTWSINSKPAEPWPEAGWISFPFDLQRPVFRLGRLGGVVNPATDFVKGSNCDFGFLNTGMAVVDGAGRGCGLCSPDAPGVSLDRPGLWKYSSSFVPQKANVFVNLYNNQWSTNFTEWVEGSWSTRIYVWAVDAFENGSSIVVPSEEHRVPLTALIGEGPAGKLPVTSSGISLSQQGVFVTAFGKNPDGDGTLLRLWEQRGIPGTCRVTLPSTAPFATAHACTLRGEKIPGKVFRIIKGSFEVVLQQYQPLSLLLEE